MHHKALRLLSIFLILSPVIAFSQNLSRSPYSIVGPGEVLYGGNVLGFGMGQVSQGIRKAFYINALNPASYSAFTQTNIEAAAIYSEGIIRNATQSNNVNNAGFAHLNFGVPVSEKKGWGFSFGLMPYSAMGYNLTSDVSIPQGLGGPPINASTSLIGKGSISKVYLGTGIRLFKDTFNNELAAGINVNYLFGELNSITRLNIPPEYNMFNLEELRSRFLNGFLMEYGLQYNKSFMGIRADGRPVQHNFCAGLSFNAGTDLNGTQDYSLRTMPIGSSQGSRDTVSNQVNSKGVMTLPAGIRLGLSFDEGEHWMVAADIGYGTWSSYRSFGQADSLLDNITLNLGGSYVPKPTDYTKLTNRIEYRAGLRFDQGNTAFYGQRIGQLGLSAGIGIPLTRSHTRVNIGIEYLRRGTTSFQLASEEYIRFMIGVSFSDKWFQRYRYD